MSPVRNMAESIRNVGADVVQQYMKAALIDEMEIHVVPPLLGGGARL